ncbi:MAG: c-type cytochrome domain-containing protein [Planctomycetota bacterium]
MKHAFWLALVAPVIASVFAGEDAGLIAREARTVLKQHCFGCHHGPGSKYREFDVTKHDTMLKGDDEGDAVVIAGQPKRSLLYTIVAEEKRMPPVATKDVLNADEIAKLERWIKASAPAFPTDARPYISLETQLTIIRDDLRNADKDVRPYLRYFTLTHLHNNPRFLNDDIASERAALSFAINSMTWRPSLVLPKALDKDETIFVVNIKDLDWDKHGIWNRILSEYPYGVDFALNKDEKLKRLGNDINDYAPDLCMIRADWFSANATRPPLYYDILYLPKTLMELEHRLSINIESNIVNEKVMRAAFPASGVSGQNRLLERHDSPIGSYFWLSYDFKARSPRSNLNRFPLGPVFHANKYPNQAFIHAGGEMIWGLPNGLQAYLLVDGKGNRIDEGPTDIVSDALKTSGTPAIVNGVSCMHCHKAGLLPFTDTVRDGNALSGEPREKVLRLYAKPDAMKRKVDEDSERFVGALMRTVSPFMKLDEKLAEFQKDPKNKGMTLSDVMKKAENPVGESARRYLLNDVDLAMAAAELGFEKPEELATIIKYNARLQALGLMPLANGQLIKRGDWEAIDGFSLFQDVARELKIASPITVISH